MGGMTRAEQPKTRTRRSAARLAADVAARLDRPLALVGLMGSGKSAVGRRLAGMLDLGFTDSDQQIVKTAGISIAEIFELAGEVKFREMEFSTLETIVSAKPQIIATGGGAFCQDRTSQLLRDSCLVVWLKASPETLLARIGNTRSRPLLHTADPRAALAALLDQRKHFYEKAHVHVDTDGLTTQRAVRAVLEMLDTVLARQ